MRIYKSISANYVFIEKRLFQVGNALILRWLTKQFFSRIYVKSFFCPADASEMEVEERKQRIDTEAEPIFRCQNHGHRDKRGVASVFLFWWHNPEGKR